MNTHLHSIAAANDTDYLVLLADYAQVEQTAAYLSPAEIAILQAAAAQQLPSMAFPQAQRTIIVDFLPAQAKSEAWMKEQVRRLAAARVQQLRRHKTTAITFANTASRNYSRDYVEGLVLANYQFLKYVQQDTPLRSPFQHINVLTSTLSEAELTSLRHELEAVCWVRDMVNEPVSYLTAEQLSTEFEALGQKAGFQVQVLRKAEIEALRMGGLLTVNRGSQDPPTFSVLEWKPTHAKNSQPIVLVGKGLVFDTGGISLKPTPNSMDSMKCDMAGGAIVAGMLYIAAKNNLPIHLVGLVPATDNRPGETACVPGDIYQTMQGAFIEVLNTDAEGRLILADALHYAKRYQPQLVLDFATLTGSAATTTGSMAGVYFSNADETVKQSIEQSGWQVFERMVEFPLWDDYAEMLKSDIADMKNIGGPVAGAITAAKFLEYFTDYPWVHFDIAGVAFLHKEEHYRVRGGTGFGLRLLSHFLQQQLG